MKTTQFMKRTLSLIFAFLICMNTFAICAYASEAESTTEEIVSTEVVTPRNGNVAFSPYKNEPVSVSLSGNCKKIIFTGVTYDGGTGIIVLRFTKTTLGDEDMKSYTFTIDGKEHTENLPYTLTAGDYKITTQACTCNCKSVFLNFK